MVRAPSVEKMGLKKGPWTPEEDQRLMAYIERHGHGNWRALPKEAGLLRCGKSCRLRWMNYLRPDIKRGNFSIEEEETIVNLFELMGSRWSAIARKLPGRTDNEIKNIWHTHLKKRLKWDHLPQQTKRRCTETPVRSSKSLINNLTSTNLENPDDVTSSPLPSSSDFSSTTTNSSVVVSENTVMELYKNPLSEAFSPENCCNPEDFPVTMSELQLVSSPVYLEDHLYLYDDADIWLNVKEEWDAKIAGI